MKERISEAARIFEEEVREKKRTASGVHHKTGKNGYVGTMRFPSDLMSRKEKYNYRKAGKVMTTNLFDEIMHIDDFKMLDKNEQKNRLSYWRIENTNKEILKGMQINSAKYYEIVNDLELPPAPRTYKSNTGEKVKNVEIKKKSKPPEGKASAAAIMQQVQEAQQVQQAQQAQNVQHMQVDGLHLVFQGTVRPEIIQKQLTKFSLLLEEEEDDFYFEIRLMQKAEKMEGEKTKNERYDS